MNTGIKSKEAENKPLFFPELDYLRGLAIFAVITTHTLVYYIKMPTLSNLMIVYMVLIAFAKYGVPAYLFVSGFVLYNKYNTKFDLKNFYIKRYVSIIPPYLIFSVLYERWNRGAITTVFFRDLLTGGANQHLWFVILIVEIYIAYPAIMHVYNYCKTQSITKFFLAIVFFINLVYNLLPWSIPVMLGWLFYFILGMYIRDNYESIGMQTIMRKYWLLIITVICIGTVSKIIDLVNTYLSTSILPNLLSIGIFYRLIDMLDCTALTVMAFYISVILYKAEKAKFISLVGSYSFAIYLIHAYIVVFLAVNSYWLDIALSDILFYPYVFLVTLIVSMTAVVLIKQLPYHEYIIGKTGS